MANRITPSEALLSMQDSLAARLRFLAYAPTIAPPAIYAAICGEAEKELRAASEVIKSLVCAIEAEGFDVLVDVDGTHSVRRRD